MEKARERPLLGILIDTQQENQITAGASDPLFRLWQSIGRQLNALVLFFSWRDVDWLGRTVSAWTMTDQEQWIPSRWPLPEIIYDYCLGEEGSKEARIVRSYLLEYAPDVRIINEHADLGEIEGREFISTHSLNLAEILGAKFVVNVLLQKTPAGGWEVAAAARLLDTATDVAGQPLFDLQQLVHEVFPGREEAIVTKLREYCRNVGDALGERFGFLSELQLELALDRQGKWWLLTTRSRPNQALHHFRIRKLSRAAAEMPIRTAFSLSQEIGGRKSSEPNTVGFIVDSWSPQLMKLYRETGRAAAALGMRSLFFAPAGILVSLGLICGYSYDFWTDRLRDSFFPIPSVILDRSQLFCRFLKTAAGQRFYRLFQRNWTVDMVNKQSGLSWEIASAVLRCFPQTRIYLRPDRPVFPHRVARVIVQKDGSALWRVQRWITMSGGESKPERQWAALSKAVRRCAVALEAGCGPFGELAFDLAFSPRGQIWLTSVDSRLSWLEAGRPPLEYMRRLAEE